jgi:hypothetical protein
MSDPNTEARILLALQVLQNNPKLKLRRAAEIYKVGRMMLWRRQKGIQSQCDWIPKSRRLSNLEEQIIIQFILDLGSRGFPPRLRGVEEMANRLLADRDAPPVGKRWASNFVKRHKELETRFFRRYDYQRAKCEDLTVIRNWFRLVENTITKYGIDLADIYNFDETGFMLGVIASRMVHRHRKMGKAEISAAWKPGMDYRHSDDQCRRLGDPAVHHRYGSISPRQVVPRKQPAGRVGYCNEPKWLDP